MKKYKITAIIETDELDPAEIKRIIDRRINRGEGIYIIVDEASLSPVDSQQEVDSIELLSEEIAKAKARLISKYLLLGMHHSTDEAQEIIAAIINS